jgi:DNA mismatch repair protein MutL
VVKEIMENSLDAGSSHIHITIVIGGIELIKIKDDGHGIHVGY